MGYKDLSKGKQAIVKMEANQVRMKLGFDFMKFILNGQVKVIEVVEDENNMPKVVYEYMGERYELKHEED